MTYTDFETAKMFDPPSPRDYRGLLSLAVELVEHSWGSKVCCRSTPLSIRIERRLSVHAPTAGAGGPTWCELLSPASSVCRRWRTRDRRSLLVTLAVGTRRNQGETAARQARDIVDTFFASRVQLLLMKCPAGFARTVAWREDLQPRLEQARWTVKDATLYTTDVGVPTGKNRVFIVVVKRQPDVKPSTLSAKLAIWKLRL